MSVAEDALAEIRETCSGAELISEGGREFIFLPALNIRTGGNATIRDALLTLQAHSGYESRLLLSEPVPARGQNWTEHYAIGRKWHSPSWNGVKPGRPAEMLAEHLRTYR
jgi:hypothetical protein